MLGYDRFSAFYDRALEGLYAAPREQAVRFCGFSAGAHVLDLPCGTGQSLALLREAVGESGRVTGIDRSAGMLGVARERASAWENVHLIEASASEVSFEGAQGVLFALGLSALPDWEGVLDRAVAELPPGAVIGAFDVFAQRWNPQKPVVEWMAGASLTRPIADALEARLVDYRHTWLPGSPWVFGGRLFAARGVVGA